MDYPKCCEHDRDTCGSHYLDSCCCCSNDPDHEVCNACGGVDRIMDTVRG